MAQAMDKNGNIITTSVKGDYTLRGVHNVIDKQFDKELPAHLKLEDSSRSSSKNKVYLSYSAHDTKNRVEWYSDKHRFKELDSGGIPINSGLLGSLF